MTSTPTRPVDNVVIATRGLPDRNINILAGTTVENKGKLILSLVSTLPRYLKWSTSFSSLLFNLICNDCHLSLLIVSPYFLPVLTNLFKIYCSPSSVFTIIAISSANLTLIILPPILTSPTSSYASFIKYSP